MGFFFLNPNMSGPLSDWSGYIFDSFSRVWKGHLPFIPFFLPIKNAEMIAGAAAVMLQASE
jgi:hypothetical protein